MKSRPGQLLPRLALLRLGIVLTAMTVEHGNALTSGCIVAHVEAQPTKVIIVRSKEVEPYKLAEQSFISSLPSNVESQSYSLAQATPELLAKAATDAGTAFFALGSEAATSVRTAIPPANTLTCAMVSDPAAAGVLAGRTTTVISMDCPYAAQISFISAALPKTHRIGILYRGDTPKGKRAIEGMRAALPSGWDIEAVEVEKEASISDAIARMFNAKVDLVWTYPDSTLYDTATIKSLLLESLRQAVPVFGFSPAFVRAGATIGVGTTPADQGRQAAESLKLSQGTGGDGDDLIVAPNMNTYVNTAVAEQLRIDLPAKIIESATTVFK